MSQAATTATGYQQYSGGLKWYSYSSGFSAAFATVADAPVGDTLLDKLKSYLGIPPDDTSQDEELTRALNIALDAIETYLDRAIVKRTLVEFFRHHFGTVVLHNYPVDTTQPVTVLLNGAEQSGYSVYLGRGQMGHLTRTGCPLDTPMDWRQLDQVEVRYTAGYDPIPSDLGQAIVYTAAEFYKIEGEGTTSTGDIKSMSIYDVGSISYDVSGDANADQVWASTGMIPDVAAQMLSRYKRMFA